MNATAPRFTEYARTTTGRGYHTVKAEKTSDGWTLTLTYTPHTVIAQPPTGEQLTGTDWAEFMAAQSTAVAARRTGRPFVTYPDGKAVEVRPSVVASELARELLGSAWTVVDLGRGYRVELS
jgi:hypothetical protein